MLSNIDWFDFVIGGILIGFIVNIAANFAQPKIATWWGKFSETRRNKNEAQKRAFDEKVDYLINNPHEELVARIQVNRYATYGNFTALLGLLGIALSDLLDLGNLLGLLIGIMGLSGAFFIYRSRNELVDILNAVDENKGRRFP